MLVEDSAELRPDHPHVVALEARPPNVEGAGEIRLRDLVRQALRMRPDRLVVGEVRGAEVVDLLAALNTGHEGGCSTLHANSTADVPARLEALGVTAGLSRDAVHAQVAAALHVVVHLQRDADGLRRVGEIGVLSVGRDGRVAQHGGAAAGPVGRDPARTCRPGARRVAGRCRVTGAFPPLLAAALAGLAVALLLPPAAGGTAAPAGAAPAPPPQCRQAHFLVVAAASWRCSLRAPARPCSC